MKNMRNTTARESSRTPRSSHATTDSKIKTVGEPSPSQGCLIITGFIRSEMLPQGEGCFQLDSRPMLFYHLIIGFDGDWHLSRPNRTSPWRAGVEEEAVNDGSFHANFSMRTFFQNLFASRF